MQYAVCIVAQHLGQILDCAPSVTNRVFIARRGAALSCGGRRRRSGVLRTDSVYVHKYDTVPKPRWGKRKYRNKINYNRHRCYYDTVGIVLIDGICMLS